MLSTSANVPREVVLVFACMFYHADYYRIIVIAYDYKCSHATFYVYVRMGSEPGIPPPPHTHTHTHTHKRTNEEDLWITTREKKKKKKKKSRKGDNKTSEIIGLHATEVQQKKKKRNSVPTPPPPKKDKRKTHPKTIKVITKK